MISFFDLSVDIAGSPGGHEDDKQYIRDAIEDGATEEEALAQLRADCANINGQLICRRIAEGESLREICKSPGMPNRSVVMRFAAKNPDFAAAMRIARDFQSEALHDDLAEIESKTLSGELDPQSARVAIQSKQWRMSRLAPKRWGDRIETVHAGEVRVEKVTRVIVDPREPS